MRQESLFKRRRGTLWALLGLALTFSAIAAFAVSAGRTSVPAGASGARMPATGASNATVPGGTAQAAIPASAELLMLTTDGFVPDQITRPAGPFYLVVEDRSGLDQATLQLTSQNGVNVRSMVSSLEKGEALDILDLQPGTYTFTEASNPKWVCEITITP